MHFLFFIHYLMIINKIRKRVDEKTNLEKARKGKQFERVYYPAF